MQGWSPDFIARLTETAAAEQLIDEVVPVAGQEALNLARSLARQEGMAVGAARNVSEPLAALRRVRRQVCGKRDRRQRVRAVEQLKIREIDNCQAA